MIKPDAFYAAAAMSSIPCEVVLRRCAPLSATPVSLWRIKMSIRTRRNRDLKVQVDATPPIQVGVDPRPRLERRYAAVGGGPARHGG